MDALTTTALTKRYGHREPPIHPPGHRSAGEILALEDLSISVREGEIFGFLGPNGAGKSTTIRLLLGYLHPSAGSATVLGRDIVRDTVEIRRRVGYLPGGIALYDSLTGERLLDYLGDLTGRPPARRAELLDRLELSARTLDRPVRDYSRGMRQKIGIIQALQHDPELAILDEPTEGLDPLMQRAFYDDPRRPQGGRSDDLLLVPHPVRGRAGVRSRRDRPARPAGRPAGGRQPAGAPEAERRAAGRRRRRAGAGRGGGRQRARADRGRAADLPARGRRGAVPGRDRGVPDHGPHDRAGASRGGVPRAVRGRRSGRGTGSGAGR